MPTLPRHRGRGTRLKDICCSGPPAPKASPRQERWVCPLLMCMAPLFSSRWPGTKHQGPEQRDLYAAPPRAGSRALFSFHPVLLDSMGRNSAPCPTVATQTSILHRGSRDAPPWRGRSQGCYKELIVCWGPGSEQGLGSGDRSQPEPCWAAGRRQGQAGGCRRGAMGPGWHGGRWRGLDPSGQVPCLTAHGEERVRNPPCEGRGSQARSPGGGAASPSLPLKAASFSGRFSSSLYFWSQRNSYRGEKTSAEQGVSSRARWHIGPLPRASSPTRWLDLAGQGGRLQRLSWLPVNPQGRSAKSTLWAGSVLGNLGWGPEGLLEKKKGQCRDLGLPQGTPALGSVKL